MLKKMFFLGGILVVGYCNGHTVPKQAGIAFRFDDNRPAEQLTSMQKVYNDNDARFSLALNVRDNFSPQYIALLVELQKQGFEIMDHTPEHRLYSHAYKNQNLEEIKKMDSFHHADAKNVYFKYALNSRFAPIPFVGDIKENKVSNIKIDSKHNRLLKSNTCIYNPQTKTAYRFVNKYDELILTSFWGEKIENLPEQKDVKLQIILKSGGFLVPEDVLHFWAKRAQSLFKSINIELPVTYIQPGGKEPVPDAENIAKVYSQYGYTGGATYPKSAVKTFNEPNPERQKFAMMWGQFSLERADISKVRTVIAEGIAKNKVLICSSHMWVKNVPGGFLEYVKRHNELLQWCKQQNVLILTQREWCDRLYHKKPDSNWNIVPSLAIDRDGNGTPDGYESIPKSAKVENGVLHLSKTGVGFEIKNLYAAEHGKNKFSFTYTSASPVEIIVTINSKISIWKKLKEHKHTFKLEAGKDITRDWVFDNPTTSNLLDIKFEVKKLSPNLEVSNISIVGL